MSLKRIFIQLIVISIMVFAVSYATEQSYAYWASNITPASQVQNETATVGDWNQVFTWDPNATYVTGDTVTNNGNTYTAKKDNPTREPGVDPGWKSEWDQN